LNAEQRIAELEVALGAKDARNIELEVRAWAIDKQWLWVHFGKKGGDPSADWFSHSHHTTGNAWTTGFGWAKQVREKLERRPGERRPHAWTVVLRRRW